MILSLILFHFRCNKKFCYFRNANFEDVSSVHVLYEKGEIFQEDTKFLSLKTSLRLEEFTQRESLSKFSWVEWSIQGYLNFQSKVLKSKYFRVFYFNISMWSRCEGKAKIDENLLSPWWNFYSLWKSYNISYQSMKRSRLSCRFKSENFPKVSVIIFNCQRGENKSLTF